MLNYWSVLSPSLFLGWVKNVYSLRKVVGITRGQTFTDHVLTGYVAVSGVNNNSIIPAFMPIFSTPLSPFNFVKSPLLYSSFTHNPHPLLLRERRKDKKGITIWS